MSEHGSEVLNELRGPSRQLRKAIPDVYQAFADLHHESLADGALDVKTKELIALAIGVTKQCDGCVASHARSAAKAGATIEEVTEMLGVCILLNGGPSTVYGPRAFEAFAEFAEA